MMRIMAGMMRNNLFNNDEYINRLKEAAMYQRKAVRCLVPDRMQQHADVIGNEIKLMLMESAGYILRECMTTSANLKGCSMDSFFGMEKDSADNSDIDNAHDTARKKSGARKVDIL